MKHSTIALDPSLNRYGEVKIEQKPEGVGIEVVTEGGKLAFTITDADAKVIAQSLIDMLRS